MEWVQQIVEVQRSSGELRKERRKSTWLCNTTHSRAAVVETTHGLLATMHGHVWAHSRRCVPRLVRLNDFSNFKRGILLFLRGFPFAGFLWGPIRIILASINPFRGRLGWIYVQFVEDWWIWRFNVKFSFSPSPFNYVSLDYITEFIYKIIQTKYNLIKYY